MKEKIIIGNMTYLASHEFDYFIHAGLLKHVLYKFIGIYIFFSVIGQVRNGS